MRVRRPPRWRRRLLRSTTCCRPTTCGATAISGRVCSASEDRLMFIDRVIVRVEAGTGGSGATSFRREKYVPQGGPDGGDGGRGGDVIIRADSNLATLLDYTYRDQWAAERGEHGMGSNKSGKSGEDLVLPVPPGTVLRDAESGEYIGEVLDAGDQVT